MVSNGNAAELSEVQVELPSRMVPDGYEPNAKDGIYLSIAVAAPAIAGVYSIVSPLGKEYDIDSEIDIESEDHILNDSANYSSQRRKSLEKRFSFATRSEQRVVEYAPVWRGSLYDFLDDIKVAYLSLFCCFCVFGWNMDRLGFGNMYFDIATFLLFCMAPFWIFNLAAISIDNETVREAMGLTGIILCVFGLLYGRFWSERDSICLPISPAVGNLP